MYLWTWKGIPQRHGHKQAEGGAARHTQLLQAQNTVHAAGDKGDEKQSR